MASAAHHAASLDLKLAIPDVAYTIIFLSGIAFTSTWADFAIPRICSIFSPDASVRSIPLSSPPRPPPLPMPSPSLPGVASTINIQSHRRTHPFSAAHRSEHDIHAHAHHHRPNSRYPKP